MILQQPGAAYSQRAEIERNRQLELADKQTFKRQQDVEIGDGRLILTSADGTRYSVVVDNAGALSTTAV